MDNTQKRRQDLLNQTRRIYSDKYKIPAVHPRYGNLGTSTVKKNEEGKDYILNFLKFRILMSLILFIIYATMEYTGATIGIHSGDTVVEIISETIDIQDVWNTW